MKRSNGMSILPRRTGWLAGLLAALMLTSCMAAQTAVEAGQAASQLVSAEVNLDAVADASAEAETTEVSEDAGAESVADAASANDDDHDDPADYVWDEADVVPIALNGDSISADSDGVSVEGCRATITAAGTYRLSGSLADGQIVVDTEDESIVRLILSGVDLRSTTSAPINVASAEKVLIVLADGTTNHVSDASTYVFEDPDEDEPNAAIFSKADLTIGGEGSLAVEGNYNDAIASKDGLIVASGNVTVNALDDGIRGKDYLIVRGGTLNVTAGGDGLKSDNEDDAERGYILIESGLLNVTAGGDAIQAATDVLISDGELVLSSGGGSSAVVDESVSAKGIKAAVNLNIEGGTFTVDSADDALHSNGTMVIDDGAFVLASGDDGMHADASLTINNGTIQVTKSYEGIESAVITINDGDINIVASDDGLNVAGGNDGSGMMAGPGRGGGGPRGDQAGQFQPPDQTGELPQDADPGQMADMGDAGAFPQGGGMDGFAASGDYYLYINGGTIVVDAGGDGLDSNGSIEMTGGTVLVNGPTNNGNGALDYMGTFNITGGFLVAAGSSGMAQAPGTGSTQYSVLVNFDSGQAAGTLVHIQTSAGEDVLTFAPSKQYQSIVLSSPGLAEGATYEVYLGGSSTGTPTGGLIHGGSYTPGTLYTSFTLSDVVTQIGSGGGFRR
jgi:hypothetical protein